jgi:outer membrane protein OmpA-like peptidoglycan-associated protein
MPSFSSAPPQRSRDEGERPFWISFADLMTALMVLFLVVMVASLVSVTQQINIGNAGAKERAKDIAELCRVLALKAKASNDDIVVDCNDNRINFGPAGQFGRNDYRLETKGKAALQSVIPLVLEAAESEEGKKWMKQILIEGSTDTDGSYLYNLHLSLQRSEWVMCSMLASTGGADHSLTARQQKLVRELFLAGGVSFNNAKESKKASRRIELRMQFYGLKDDRLAQSQPVFDITKDEVCQIR